PPINWGPSLEREGGEEDCSGSASSFKPGGSKQPKGFFHASSLEAKGQKEVAIFTLRDLIRVGSARHVQLTPQ
ncbi:MAG: hypothetical protein WBP33_09795, partial [Saprospiraceae bacterium]